MNYVKDFALDWSNFASTVGEFRAYTKIYYSQNQNANQTKYKIDLYGQLLDLGHWVNKAQYSFVTSINGNVQNWNGQIDTTNVGSGQLVYIGSQELTIGNNTDGSSPQGTFGLGGHCNMYLYDPYTPDWTGYSQYKEASTTYTAPTILRNSILDKIINDDTTLSILPIETTTHVKVNYNKYVTNYYDKLVVKLGNTVIKTINGTTSPYLFYFTSSEIETIQNLMPLNTTNLTFVLSTYTDSNMTTQVGSSSSKDVQAVIVNANPIFTDFEVSDVNTITQTILNDNSYFINGLSNLNVLINTTNKAVAQKGATMSYYRVIVDGKTLQQNYSDTDLNITGNELNAITSPVVKVYAVDSRGNTTEVIKNIVNWVTYAEAKKYSNSCSRTNATNEETNFKLQGLWTNTNFKDVANALTVSYHYKKTGSDTWINGTSIINLTIDNGDFTFDGVLKGDLDTGFDISNSYDVEIIVNDKFTSAKFEYLVPAGTPALDIYKNFLAIHGMYDESLGGILQIGGQVIAEIVED